MEFYLDLSDPIIQKVMISLGIKDEELKIKPLEYFAGEDLSKEIQEIRYNHHLSKAENAVKRIKEYIQIAEEEELKKKMKKTPIKHLTIDKIKKNYNQRILQFLESEKQSRKLEERMNKEMSKNRGSDSKNDDDKESIKKKKEDAKMKHIQNMKSLDLARKLQEEVTIERLSRVAVTPRIIQSSPRTRRNHVFSLTLTLDEKEIDSKLQQFNNKINKSSEKYQKCLNEKAETAKNHRKRRNSLNNSFKYDQKLMIITTKYDNAYTRRKKIREDFIEKVTEKEAKFTEIHEKVRRIYELESVKNIQQSRNIEENNERVEEIIEELRKKKRDLSEKKSEKAKALEAGINDKVQKIKKMEHERKEKILEKHFQIERKKKEHFDKLEIENKSIRQKAVKFMIEKEKSQALKFMISKAQTPGELQKLMEKVQITNINNNPQT